MKFKSENEAKDYAISLSARHIRPDEVEGKLNTYKSYLESAFTEDDKAYWQNEIKRFEEWLNSEDYKNGNYPQGIDELILELIEWRASIYAFQNLVTKEDPFKRHAFYAQWLMGGTYTIFCILGKLVSKDGRDNSLRKLWSAVSHYVANSGLCDKRELECIAEKMHRTEGHFTNTNSQAMLFRNKVIAHNESTPQIEWVDIDNDIKLLCRIWALNSMWSSIGIIQPFRKSENAFSGLGEVFTADELKLLKTKRAQYLDKVEKWCSCSIVTGKKTSERSPFGKFSMSIKVNSTSTIEKKSA